MQPGIERFAEVQRAVLVTLRTMFVAGLEAFSSIHNQMGGLLRTFVEKTAESQQAGFKFVEDWVANFRRAQAEFQQMVDEAFKRADVTLALTAGTAGGEDKKTAVETADTPEATEAEQEKPAKKADSPADPPAVEPAAAADDE